MLQVSLWSRIITAIILIAGLLIALPNALPEQARAKIPGWLPSQTVSLGLDLQGGSYLLLEVQLEKVQKDKLEGLLADLRAGFNKRPRIGYKDPAVSGTDTLTVTVTDPTRMADARKIINDLNAQVSSGLLGTAAREFDVAETPDGKFVLKMTDSYKTTTKQQLLEQSREVVSRRIDEMGTREPTVQRQGEDRILVQVPGLKDPAFLKTQLGKTAKMTFQFVDTTHDAIQAQQSGIIPIGDLLLPQQQEKGGQPLPPLLVEKRVIVDGSRLDTDRVSAGFNQQSTGAIVNFGFDTVGARQFGDATKNNVGRLFAVVLDDQVISAPRINTPILGGQGYIEGNFTMESATALAQLLRAGALPAPLKVIEERTVGAELGADSVKAGSYSAVAGLVLVVLFMIARYGLFGFFADIALTLNMVLLMAILTLLGATLTLPGIAGMVLTMGMAVDANVLIYERIREEVRNGRSMLAAIDSGFKRAMATIVDANMTHLIAAAILFMVGSGPVRGFAVTLGFGIITSFFTAVMVTRLIVIFWLQIRRPKKLYI